MGNVARRTGPDKPHPLTPSPEGEGGPPYSPREYFTLCGAAMDPNLHICRKPAR